MSKKEILTLIAVGIILYFGACFGAYALSSSSQNQNTGGAVTPEPTTTNTPTDENVLKVGNYTLHYGNYYCEYEEYDPDTGTMSMYESILQLSKDKITIGGKIQKYTVEDDTIKNEDGIIVRAIANDKLRVEAGAGMEYSYQKEQ